MRLLGALSLLAVGAVHLQQYEALYSTIPTIGVLFVLNFVGATVLGLALLVPFERLVPHHARVAVGVVAIGGIVLSAVSFVFLLVAERTPLFGFMEPGYDPAAIQAARVSELATVGLLGAYVLARHLPRRRLVTRGPFATLAVAAAAIALAACGGGSGTSSSASASHDSGAGTATTTVSTKRVDGKRVLVDGSGLALYASDQEMSGAVRCTGGCTSFWKPLTIRDGQPTGTAPGGLGVVHRPDGTTQVTVGGAPVYRFVEDHAGKIAGDGVKDAFDGRQFTWHVVAAGATTPSTSAPGGSTGSGGFGY